MIFDDLGYDIRKFISHGRKKDKVLQYLNVFILHQEISFESEIFDAEHDKQKLNDIFMRMNAYYQQVQQFFKSIERVLPEADKYSKIVEILKKHVWNMIMIQKELHAPQLHSEINVQFCLRWFELKFLKFMSEIEERSRNLTWQIKMSPTEGEKNIYRKHLLKTYNLFMEKIKYFEALMDEFEHDKIEYHGVKIHPTRKDVEGLNDFKSNFRIWNVKMQSIYTKSELDKVKE